MFGNAAVCLYDNTTVTCSATVKYSHVGSLLNPTLSFSVLAFLHLFLLTLFPHPLLLWHTPLQIEAVEWPFDNTNNSKGARPSNVQNIAELLLDKKMDLVINLPMHIRPGTVTTNGYQIRRMAVEYSVPLINDIKCAKLFVKVMTPVLEVPILYVHTHMHIHTHAHTYIHTYTHIHTHAHTCTHMHTHAHTCTYMHIHTHTCTYMHIHTHIHLHTYTHMEYGS